jgi:hypothetical protein
MKSWRPDRSLVPAPVDLGALQVLADLVRELGGQVAGQSLGDPLAGGLRDPAGGALGVAAAG